MKLSYSNAIIEYYQWYKSIPDLLPSYSFESTISPSSLPEKSKKKELTSWSIKTVIAELKIKNISM